MNTAEALNEVNKFARVIKAFEHLGEVIDALSKAENLIKERDDKLDAQELVISERNAELDALAEEINGQAEKFQEGIDVAQASNDELLAKARAEAAAIIVEANSERDQLIEDNQLAATELRALQQKITATQAEYDDLLPKLATVREQARKILGGGA